MIYIDSSVALAQLFTEPGTVPDVLWEGPVVSSRLLAYEVWNRIHARELAVRLGQQAEVLLKHTNLIDLSPEVLDRALQPFPRSVKTLDALHLATVEYLRSQGQSIQLASFDNRMIDVARALGVNVYDL